MLRLGAKFKELELRKEGALLPYITIGDPDYKTSLEIAKTIIQAGADVLELGIAHSDPIADGPTIQAATQRALKKGFNMDKAFDFVAEIRKEFDIPLVFLIYYNMVHARGDERFFQDCSEYGVDGVIIPDLPFEENAEVRKIASKNQVDIIQLVAPTTSDERLEKIVKSTTGFVYLLSLLGVTGARDSLSEMVDPFISRVLDVSKGEIPVSVGFGISKPEHVKAVIKAGSSGVIVGSALISLISEGKSIEKIENFIKEMKAATLLNQLNGE